MRRIHKECVKRILVAISNSELKENVCSLGNQGNQQQKRLNAVSQGKIFFKKGANLDEERSTRPGMSKYENKV